MKIGDLYRPTKYGLRRFTKELSNRVYAVERISPDGESMEFEAVDGIWCVVDGDPEFDKIFKRVTMTGYLKLLQ